MELLKLLSANEIVAQILSFLIVLWLLKAFMWKRVLKLLDDRRQSIVSEFDRIEAAKIEVAKLKTDYEAKMAKIAEEARKKIQEAKEEGNKITEEIRKKAYLEAQDIIKNAKASMKYELDKAKVAIKEDLVNITIKAAEHLIEERLDEKHDKKLVEDFLNNLSEVE